LRADFRAVEFLKLSLSLLSGSLQTGFARPCYRSHSASVPLCARSRLWGGARGQRERVAGLHSRRKNTEWGEHVLSRKSIAGLSLALAVAAGGCVGPFAPHSSGTTKSTPAASSSGTKESKQKSSDS